MKIIDLFAKYQKPTICAECRHHKHEEHDVDKDVPAIIRIDYCLASRMPPAYDLVSGKKLTPDYELCLVVNDGKCKKFEAK